MHQDVAGRRGLEQVDAAKHRGLAGAGRTQDHDDLARPDVQVDVTQDHVVVERLVQVLDTDDRVLALLEVVAGKGLVMLKGELRGLVGIHRIGHTIELLASVLLATQHRSHLP